MSLVLVWLAWFCYPLFAQAESFNISSFVPPKGWIRKESSGVLIFENRKTVQGRTEFCQIYLFASRPTSESPAENFQAEWDAKISKGLGIGGKPSPRGDTEPDGWTTLIGFVDSIREGVPVRSILVTKSGPGKYVCVLILVSPNSYQSEIEGFFDTLNVKNGSGLRIQPGQPANSGPASASGRAEDSNRPSSLSDYVYVAPPAWTRQLLRDRIVLTSPTYSPRDTCQITMMAPRPLSKPLNEYAVEAFRAIFRFDPLPVYPAPPMTWASGISQQGWEYITIRKLTGQESVEGTMGTILMVVKLGEQVAIITGMSKDFMVSRCFSLMPGGGSYDAWPGFFHTLQFKNVRPSGRELAFVNQTLPGTWVTATSSAGLRYEFRADGRYSDAGAAQQRTRISRTEVLRTTQAYFGNGIYSINGSTLVLSDDDGRTRTSYFFRLELVSRHPSSPAVYELCLLQGGSLGEVCYSRQ